MSLLTLGVVKQHHPKPFNLAAPKYLAKQNFARSNRRCGWNDVVGTCKNLHCWIFMGCQIKWFRRMAD